MGAVVKRSCDKIGPSKMAVFEELAFWLHVVFKFGIPLFCLQGLTSEGCESSGLDDIGSI